MRKFKLLITFISIFLFLTALVISCKKNKDQDVLTPKTTDHFKADDPLKGSTAYCGTDIKKSVGEDPSNTNKSVTQNTIVHNTDFVSAGAGGMRNTNTGTITLSGVTGTVTSAILYWHGLTTAGTDIPSVVTVNGTPVPGTNIGVSSTNCWGSGTSQAYRADVTSIVQALGNGNYNLSGFGFISPNGASLLVFYNDGNPSNNRDVVLFDGNDSNEFFAGIPGNPNAPADPEGWNVSLSGINYTAGSANIQLHVGDGQTFTDGAIQINAVQLVPAGPNFNGNTVPGPDIASGNLWDIRTYDVTSFLTPGPNNLTLTSGILSDCLGLIVAVIDLPAGAAPPPPCQVNAQCKNATVTLVNGTVTVTPADVDNGSTSTCDIQSMTVTPSTFNCSNIGSNSVVLTITDVNGNVSSCTSTVTVVGEIPSCSISVVPSNNTYTGGVSTNLYLGYGPQSVMLNVNAPALGAPYSYSWTPATGLSSTISGSPVFTPTAAGVYTFTVTTTNKYGCTTTCSKTIIVKDVRCGNNMNKVMICHKPGTPAMKTLCVDASGAADHLAHGDYLGTCN